MDEIPQVETTKKRFSLDFIFHSGFFTYFYMVVLLVYILICGFVMVYAGTLLLESILNGWYRMDFNDYEFQSFMLGYLYSFPSLMGLVGGLLVLSTRAPRMYKFKILFFVPSIIWASLLIIGNLKWGFTYWTQWLFLFPILFINIVILLGVIKKVNIPYFARA